jgi:hypothetical protein
VTATKSDPEAGVLWVPKLIPVAALKVGNRIVLKTAPFRKDSLTEEQRENVLAYFFFEREEVLQVTKSKKVDTVDPCNPFSKNPQKVHVNGNQCYDIRTAVWIAVPL